MGLDVEKWMNGLLLPSGGKDAKIQATHSVLFSSVQSLSPVPLFATPWTPYARLPVHQQLPELAKFKLMSIESVMPSNHLILCHPLLLLPPIPPSIRVFSNESLFA